MRVEIEGGKYAVVFDRESGALHAERNGDAWRDLTGDKLVYALAAEVERLREVVAEVHSWAVCAPIASAEDMAQNFPRIIKITTPAGAA